MPDRRHLASPLLIFAVLAALPPLARARAEAGTKLDNVELRTIAGGKATLLSPRAKANVFVFFRTGQERSLDGSPESSISAIVAQQAVRVFRSEPRV